MEEARVSKTAWLLLIFGFLLTVLQLLSMLAPAGLLTAIMSQTGWSMVQAGYLLSVMAPVSGLFIFVASPLMDRLGLVRVAFLGLMIMGIGCLLAVVFGNNYALQLSARVLLGIGAGCVMNVPPVIIAVYFPPGMQSSLQGLRTAIMYAGMAMAYYIVIPFFRAVGESWQRTLGIFGLSLVVLAFLFLLFGKEKNQASAASAPAAASAVDAAIAPPYQGESGLKQAANRKEVWKITAALFFVLWSFSSYNNFFPTFLQQVHGLDIVAASGFTGLMPIAGILAGVVCGAVSTASGCRNLINAPVILLMLLGYVGASLLVPGFSRALFIVCVLIGGFGASGYAVYYCTVPTEWEGANPPLIGGALAIMVGVGTTLTVFIPVVFGIVVKAIGMQQAMLWMHLPLIIAIALMLTMKETGPGAKKK